MESAVQTGQLPQTNIKTSKISVTLTERLERIPGGRLYELTPIRLGHIHQLFHTLSRLQDLQRLAGGTTQLATLVLQGLGEYHNRLPNKKTVRELLKITRDSFHMNLNVRDLLWTISLQF